MEANRRMRKALHGLLAMREYPSKKAAMDDRKLERETFTREEFRTDPQRVMRTVADAGRVVVTDGGRPHLTISRQTEELAR
jgi:hypothetical protein